MNFGKAHLEVAAIQGHGRAFVDTRKVSERPTISIGERNDFDNDLPDSNIALQVR